MQSCIDGSGVSWPKRLAYIWSSDSPTKTSEPWVCFGWHWVRNTALERKWSPPISGVVKASAMRTSVLLMMVTWSRNGSSGLRLLGLRSNAVPRLRRRPQVLLDAERGAARGAVDHLDGHQAHLPRAGPRACPAAMAAGAIASSNGKANDTPRPFSIVRRGRCLPVRIM